MMNCADELYNVDNPKRPTKRLSHLKQVQQAIEEYIKHKIAYKGEFPSSKGIACSHQGGGTCCSGEFPDQAKSVDQHNVDICQMEECLFGLKNGVLDAYNLLRKPAKEVLVAVLTDMDRIKVDQNFLK